MRSLGVRSLFATCLACGSKTEVNVDAWPDAGDAAMSLIAEQPRALATLAISGCNGATQLRLIAIAAETRREAY